MDPLFKSDPLPIAKASSTCAPCGRVLEVIAYCGSDADTLDHNLAVLTERHRRAHEAVDSGDKSSLAAASWKGPEAP